MRILNIFYVKILTFAKWFTIGGGLTGLLAKSTGRKPLGNFAAKNQIH